MTLHLAHPFDSLIPDYLTMLQELPPEDSWNGYMIRRPSQDSQVFIDQMRAEHEGHNLPEGWVPQTTFWPVLNGRLVGEARLRHSLTPSLLLEGGNIGFMIRPSLHGKGHATQVLQLVLQEARNLNLQRVLLTTAVDNIASRRVILKNGGVPDSQPALANQDKLRYWIEL
jgi:predicted acetyltransferase